MFLTEVYEQPRVIESILAERVSIPSATVSFNAKPLHGTSPSSVLLSGSGSAYHSSLSGRSFLSERGFNSCSVKLASEIRSLGSRHRNSWGIFIDASGETSDTLEAAHLARNAGIFTIGLTNGTGSDLARIVDVPIDTIAGAESGISASKSFLAELVNLYLLSLCLFPPAQEQLRDNLTAIRSLPATVQQVFGLESQLEAVGARLASYESAFLIGLGNHYPIALEGSLKLKEVAHLHAEGISAGEMEHGSLALVNEDTPVIALVPSDQAKGRLLKTMAAVKARGAPIIALTDSSSVDVRWLADEAIYTPPCSPSLSPIIMTVALQLLAYYCGGHRGVLVEGPGNTA